MVITYGLKTKIYEEKFLENERDPLTGGSGVWLRSQRRYVTIFFILPVLCRRAAVEACSQESGQSIPVELWSEKMKDEGDRLLANAGSWLRYGWLAPSLLVFLAALFIWGIASGASKRNLEEQQTLYFAEPKAGDIVIALDREDPDDWTTEYRTAFKITKVEDEFIYALRSAEKKPGGWEKLKDRPGIARSFNLSDAMFGGEPQRFSRYMYNHSSGSHTLQDVSVPFKDRRYGMSADLVIRPNSK
ncbi:hypothetical protein [Breznakiella homolactica]|uniref:Uncharacterized protein n=1 Tax=Breznakiella homolactica TaxID=2798577 RepID=A0A7T7XJV4_9SPIR|nr:hypothetical protein [Breznakiella homolactica]QQO07583.1 hypothetical protein JFL75_11560 [Breznakiella homolactica]